jgi:PAT family beta-lactamase induction signal transducer AmpG
LPRVFAGPVSGFLVAAIGWRDFFWLTIACGIPGLVFLARFVPPGTREPEFPVETIAPRAPLTAAEITLRGVVGAVVATAAAACVLALVPWAKGTAFTTALVDVVRPAEPAAWLQLVGLVVFGALTGLFAAAVAAARHGAAPSEEPA